jgi:hypothetical protein
MSALFPWPARSERKAAIAKARDGREQAEARAAEAVGVEAQIRQMAAQNHFAQVIAEQLTQHHRREA